MLSVLTLGYIFNFIDRQVMTILLEPIKAEFGATDTQMGLLTGLAFALLYATLGVPMARLADRWSRRNVLAMSMAVWSGMTALCATASSFGQLALYRIGVGVGEAGGMPPSQSLLAYVFPPEQRSLAQGVLASGTKVAVLVGLFGGALLADAYGWRNVFWIFGLPGVALAVLIRATVREPVRAKQPALDDSSLWVAIRRIIALPGFVAIGLAVGMTGFGVWARGLVPEFCDPGTWPQSCGCRTVPGSDWRFRRYSGDFIECHIGGPPRSAGRKMAVATANDRCLDIHTHASAVFAVACRAGVVYRVEGLSCRAGIYVS